MTTRERDELTAEWLKALRSGEYAQTTKVLCNKDPGLGEVGYCCLGVAGKLIGLSDEELMEPTYPSYHLIQEAYGLAHNMGIYAGGALYYHNDRDGWDFNKIADLIESRPEGLFE
jgi:hypothetical protein